MTMFSVNLPALTNTTSPGHAAATACWIVAHGCEGDRHPAGDAPSAAEPTNRGPHATALPPSTTPLVESAALDVASPTVATVHALAATANAPVTRLTARRIIWLRTPSQPHYGAVFWYRQRFARVNG
jgi:hypothetical protein